MESARHPNTQCQALPLARFHPGTLTGAFFGYTRQSNPPTNRTMAYKRSGNKTTGKQGPGASSSERTHKKYSVNYQNGKQPKYNGKPYEKSPY